MAKKRSASSARVARAGKSAKRTMDDEGIDFSDIPETTDTELKRARRVGRPTTGNAKQLIAIRFPPAAREKLRKAALKKAKPYQTYIHELLEKAVKDAA